MKIIYRAFVEAVPITVLTFIATDVSPEPTWTRSLMWTAFSFGMSFVCFSLLGRLREEKRVFVELRAALAQAQAQLEAAAARDEAVECGATAASPYREPGADTPKASPRALAIATEIDKLQDLPTVEDYEYMAGYAAYFGPGVHTSPNHANNDTKGAYTRTAAALRAIVGSEVVRRRVRVELGEVRARLEALEQQEREIEAVAGGKRGRA